MKDIEKRVMKVLTPVELTGEFICNDEELMKVIQSLIDEAKREERKKMEQKWVEKSKLNLFGVDDARFIYHLDTPSEFAEKCRRCGCRIKMIEEGTFDNPVSDITECYCLKLSWSNNLRIGGGNLTFGENKILKDKKEDK